ncbi:MAG: tetratricopeptide repeat protein [Bacteroidota bacterium]
MRRILVSAISALLLILQLPAVAQQPTNPGSHTSDLSSAKDLFLKEKYGATRETYSRIKSGDDLLVGFDAEKDFYTSVSAAELQHGDAAALLKEFLKTYPENTRSNRAWFQLGNLQFRNNSYRSALDAYSKVDPYDMNAEENAEFAFKKGYCYFKQENYDEAADAFYRIKEQQTKYTGPANYYYAHIMYASGKYETALRDFEKLRDDETFKNVVPYYIIQIYYLQGRHDEMLDLAGPYLSGQHNKRTNEILRLAADVNYRKGNYAEAVRLMEEYRSVSRNKGNRGESYLLGYSYYKTGNYTKAIPEFQSVTTENDSMAQNAYYHLGDCYLKTDQKKFASGSFLAAWKIPVKSDIAEDALFNYAKLSIELSYNPYNEAIKALQQYLNEYPESTRRDEAFTYLANLYMVTKNYREALITLENIKKRNASQNTIYQKITYFRGLELFTDNQFFDAIGQFKKSLDNRSDDEITAGAMFWMAECYYRLGQYEIAAGYYDKFLGVSGAEKYTSYGTVNYSLGYSYLKLKNYTAAKQAFTRYIESRPADIKMLNDARLRLADCHLMMKQYKDAILQYDQAIAARASDADYALYQKSIAVGVTGNLNQKLSSLQKLLADYPRSNYSDDARFEMGRTLVSLKRNEEALSAFQKVITDYPRSSIVKNALLNIGLVYYNINRDQKALETFKKVVSDYPATPEAREALAVIRNIYVDMNQVDSFVEYTADIPFANVTLSEQDSLTFTAVENRYMSGDCEKAVTGFASYLQKFPNGSFAVNAGFYKADCEARTGKTDDALKSLEAVLSHPRNRFTEKAALKSAEILYKNRDYEKALAMFQRLEENAESKDNMTEAITGQMRCQYYTGNHGLAILNGQRLLQQEDLSQGLIAEANLITGNSARILNRPELARSSYGETIKRSQGEYGAEALFSLAEMCFLEKDYKNTEKYIFKLTGDYASYDYWVARAFILLSDVYLKTGNTFQAKQTLQSIIDNYDGEDLKRIAIEKLALLEQTESKQPVNQEFDDEDGIIIR